MKSKQGGIFVCSFNRLFFVHFSEGQLRPVACGALRCEGKNASFLGKKYQFLSYKEFFFSSVVKKGLRYFEF